MPLAIFFACISYSGVLFCTFLAEIKLQYTSSRIESLKRMTQDKKLEILEKLTYQPHSGAKILPKHTDKVILPEKILNSLIELQKLHDLGSLPHPLVFRLSTPSQNTYVGVKEFHDKDESSIFLSEDITKRLKICPPIHDNIEEYPETDDQAEILSIELALNVSAIDNTTKKATIELAPRENYRVLDWKSFLEATLPANYTAVTTNDVLIFDFDQQQFVLDVISVKTTENIRTVCVIDRDIELKIKTPSGIEGDLSPESNNSHRDTLPGEYVDLFGDKEGEIQVGERVKLKIGSAESFVADGEFSLAFDQFVSDSRFETATMDRPEKEWTNDTDDEINIYVYGFGKYYDHSLSAIKFTILKERKQDKDSRSEESEILDADSVRCIYCKNIIKASSQVLHENFCRRNNVLCPEGCGEVFLKTVPSTHWHCCSTYGDSDWSKKLHSEYMHDDISVVGVTCEQCKEYHCTTRYILSQHISRDCPKAIHECRYCHLVVARGEPCGESRFYGVSLHEWLCGSKTTECPKCNKIIKLRDLETHLKLHDMDRLNNSIPQVCSNELCVNVVGTVDENALGLCKDCFGSLYSTVYDPDGKKLMQRIERRYILQIKNGCGSRDCENELCGTSAKCKVPSETRESMAGVVKFVKGEVMKEVLNRKKLHFQFCVSKSMEHRRRFVSMFEGGEWARGWICKSNEVCGNDVKAMGQWLERNAVTNIEYGR